MFMKNPAAGLRLSTMMHLAQDAVAFGAGTAATMMCHPTRTPAMTAMLGGSLKSIEVFLPPGPLCTVLSQWQAAAVGGAVTAIVSGSSRDPSAVLVVAGVAAGAGLARAGGPAETLGCLGCIPAGYAGWCLAGRLLRAAGGTASRPNANETEAPEPGRVYLVGAGPGGAGLISVRGQQLLRSADVVVADELAEPALLEQARGSVVIVGKRGGNKAGSVPQEQINALIVQRALEGQSVVRLKGGDPLVFGRVQMEIAAMDAAGVPWVIVPGITSALAAAAAVGIPVTDKEESKSFIVLSGHAPDIHRWEVVANVDTVLILMGTLKLPTIVELLRTHGKTPDTPVAIVQWAYTPNQRLIAATLGTVVEAAGGGKGLSPAIIIVGSVARHARA